MRIPLLDLKQQIQGVEPALHEAMEEIIASTAFVGGAVVSEFEREFAAYCEAPFAIGCGNGTDALEMALDALGVGKGDRVVTVSHTFIATVEAIVSVGAEPVLVDVDPGTLVMDLNALERALDRESGIRAIIPVHLYGNMVPMDGLMALADKHRIPVIEDTAQAHGARYLGRRAGTFGQVATFSFFPGKNLGAFGDAGAVVTRDPDVRAKLAARRDHGRREKYKHDFFGRNSRLDPLQAAVLRVKLPHLDTWNEGRRRVAARYHELLPREVERVQVTPSCEPVYHQYVVRHPLRDKIRAGLAEAGIDAGVHYPIPVHKQPAWRARGFKEITLPVTERAADEVLSLPVYPELSDAQIARVVEAIKSSL